MKAYHMNGAGNAFIMLDVRGEAFEAPSAEAVQALEVRYGQFDQLIVLGGTRDGLSLRFWNVDGGEAGACGNGTRAAAWLVYAGGDKGELILNTRERALKARHGANGLVEVDMGAPQLNWRDIPLRQEFDTVRMDYSAEAEGVTLSGPGAVSMGNPHCVFHVEDLARTPIHRIGPQVECDLIFPERVNVGFAQVRARDDVRLRVWERGTGLTKACGTGACAALVALHRQGVVDREARLSADGGDLYARWDAHTDHVHLAGPVEMERQLDDFHL
ncbi:diaminopimelate epimerase [Woodsholea maritima]|uniref:diaminopimelate epimerase n=1 Tax=Woodsholea maritima TaxID=240237 RepID=UPI00036A12A7|nr:diaminopimelate epimerase [Woodsholea maritima]